MLNFDSKGQPSKPVAYSLTSSLARHEHVSLVNTHEKLRLNRVSRRTTPNLTCWKLIYMYKLGKFYCTPRIQLHNTNETCSCISAFAFECECHILFHSIAAHNCRSILNLSCYIDAPLCQLNQLLDLDCNNLVNALNR